MPPAVQPNRLLQEASPYLQQHAYNPVDWYPWGPEALARARQEDRPILLSVGYSTCHWCHVMAHECFEDPAIARIMNENFVNIKVDREERPDLDDIYMHAVQMLTGRGGWPLTVFLTPELQPFYGGTYFPPEDRGGLPGFPRLLAALAEAYRSKKANIANVAGILQQNLQILALTPEPGPGPKLEHLDHVMDQVLAYFDEQNGGFAGAPKFPPALDLGFWARYYHRTGRADVLAKFLFTLQKMGRGGIYDQLGGGFHRYTVDAVWLIPHFEKMLYDNAQLAQRYLEAYQLSGDTWYADIARDTLDYVLAEMTSPRGAFYAAQDADSEGVEGKFFIWTPQQITAVVGEADSPLVQAAFGVTATGNFEHGTSVLHRPLTDAELARKFGRREEEVREILRQARERLYAAREERIRPHRDEKIITAWNGLMIGAMALGGQVLAEPKFRQAAVRAATFILAQEEQTGRMQRTWSPGGVNPPAFLDDYAYLIAALLDVFESDFHPRWLQAASRLSQEVERLFADEAAGGYFSTPQDHETLLVRPKNFQDLAVPSGNSVMVHNLIRLYRFTERPDLWARADRLLTCLQNLLLENPRAVSHLAAAQESFLVPPLGITLVGEADHPIIQEMLAAVSGQFLPHRRLVLKTPENAAALINLVPSVREYEQIGGRPTAFVCPGTTCLAPVQSGADLAEQLARLEKGQG